MAFAKGDRVSWKWGAGVGEGEIVERFTPKVTRTLKGVKVTRNGSEAEPAFLIKQDDGARVLKSASELDKA